MKYFQTLSPDREIASISSLTFDSNEKAKCPVHGWKTEVKMFELLDHAPITPKLNE
jgi:hypothetical protein